MDFHPDKIGIEISNLSAGTITVARVDPIESSERTIHSVVLIELCAMCLEVVKGIHGSRFNRKEEFSFDGRKTV